MKPNLKPVKALCRDNPDSCKEGGVRWQIFNADTNGLAESGAIVRIGRKLLIDEDKYFAWVMAQNGGAAA